MAAAQHPPAEQQPPAAQQPPAEQQPPAAQQPPAPTATGGWKNNVIVAGIVSAAVAGLISGGTAWWVTNQQNKNATSQAVSGQQVQAAQELEAAATSMYQAATDVYNFQLKCTRGSTTSQGCAAEALQIYPSYSSAITTIATDSSNIADPQAAQLGNQLGNEAGGMIDSQPRTKMKKLWYDLVTTYTELLGRCGQLVQASK